MRERELNFQGRSPLLYLLATPIGNLEEISPRTKNIIEQAEYIACEDTRNSGLLLSRLGFDKKLISCHEHNEEQASEQIVRLLNEGKKVAYMSDAGYPAISDPGSRLVANCLANGIKVATVSGPNAALNALASSGLDSTHFYFHGFLSAKPSERDTELEQIKNRKETVIFYESPHRIKKTLTALYESLGERKAVIARELTKAHEEYIRGNLKEFLDLDETTLKGEMVIIVEGDKSQPVVSEEAILEQLKSLLDEGLRSKEAIKKTAELLSVNKNQVYSLYLANFKNSLNRRR